MFVVDTCLLIDVLFADKAWAKPSARLLAKHVPQGLVVSPITLIELAPAFGGRRLMQREYLEGIGVDYQCSWSDADTNAASDAWVAYAKARRMKRVTKRPIADVMIGAFACRFTGLLTRNVDDFAPLFPQLIIRHP